MLHTHKKLIRNTLNITMLLQVISDPVLHFCSFGFSSNNFFEGHCHLKNFQLCSVYDFILIFNIFCYAFKFKHIFMCVCFSMCTCKSLTSTDTYIHNPLKFNLMLQVISLNICIQKSIYTSYFKI
jgi:hypothetical protein